MQVVVSAGVPGGLVDPTNMWLGAASPSVILR